MLFVVILNLVLKSELEELAEDIIALIHSFSGELYGLRHKIKKGLEEDDKES